MKMRRLCALLLVALLLPGWALASALPEPTQDFYVYDGANVLEYETEGHIVFCSRALYEACGAQLVFVTVDSVNGENMEDYCYDLFNEWGIGDSRKQNGFLFVLAIDDDDYGWMPGTGLDLELSAGTVKSMANELLEPDFVAKNYDEGVRKLYDALFEKIAQICDADVTLSEGDAQFEAYLQEAPSGEAESYDFGGSAYNGYSGGQGGCLSALSCASCLGCGGCSGIAIIVLILLLLALGAGGGYGYRRYRRNHPPVRPPRGSFWGAPRPGTHPRPQRRNPHSRGFGGGFFGGGFGGFGGGARGGGGSTRGGGGSRSGGFRSSGRRSGGFGGGSRGGGGRTRGGGGSRGR